MVENMKTKRAENPILNNPYKEPKRHYATDLNGDLNYADMRNGRRLFTHDVQAIPIRQGPQGSFFEINEFQAKYGICVVNLIRNEVGKWRAAGYPNATRVTTELLNFWFDYENRIEGKKLFFAQREAIETAVWLNEVASRSNPGQHILNQLKQAQVESESEQSLSRIAFKMATGTGKTVVMGALILYHFFNRREYRNDPRFADYFLIVTPGITIRERLGVLYVDTTNKHADIRDYYRIRGLVPKDREQFLPNLNARIIITNYHAFEPKTLQGNKRSPFDGKLDAQGKKIEAREDYSQVMKRLLGGFKPKSRVLILNDEAHHCYLPKSKGKNTEEEKSEDENIRAAVWYSGLLETKKRFNVQWVYDLSATPYFLQGSGYPPSTLFPWIVSDFGLIEAIESGLVKIPFIPESDNTQQLSMPVLQNLYEHVKNDLPKKGRKAAQKQGELAPKIPGQVKAALDQFYSHYQKIYSGYGKTQLELFGIPPVFIIVCNNTSVSREVYKYIAGYELTDADGNFISMVPGCFRLFSNFDENNTPLRRPPTLLIDSYALENSDQISDEFKKVFAPEIGNFKREYRNTHNKSVENLTDADILREVVNTVGKKDKLGSHVRCVVSVSMLTEGWDANSVTHIMGLRAFGSQLLCEQVAGRALRRLSYHLGKDGRFPPEYAYIIGVPFKLFKGGETPPPEPPVTHTKIYALPDRQLAHEITFPNLNGYRIEHIEGHITADFSKIENFEIDGSRFSVETVMSSAFSKEKENLTVETVLAKRDQELIYLITKELISHYYSDDDGQPFFQKFNKLKMIVQNWYDSNVIVIGIRRKPEYKKLLYFYDPKTICDHIMRGIYAEQRHSDKIMPVFNYYNQFGSSKYVRGETVKPVYPTIKSHVNYVVADTESWEQSAAKALEELDEVISYVKNAYLGFAIPYTAHGKDNREYFPDFIARCKNRHGKTINLIIEISGMNQDKAEKCWFVENRWLPAVNAVKDRYGYDEWHFIEIANDIRDIKNRLLDKIESL